MENVDGIYVTSTMDMYMYMYWQNEKHCYSANVETFSLYGTE